MCHKPYTKDNQKTEDSLVQNITIVIVAFNRSNPNIRPLGHHLAQEYSHNIIICTVAEIATSVQVKA
jgi:GT2 family glycosyltransferase